MILYAVTIFLSAFLLFQVQPLIAKLILPWFGGTSAVWSSCMLFFQVVLLGGYLYAHWLHEKLSPRWQALVHTAVLGASLLVLPLHPDASWKGEALRNPSWAILGLLATAVGLPYFVLSTTSPLIQAWYAKSHAGSVPYRLFALSNLASLLALVSYPALVEPALSLRHQSLAWSAGYACFAVLCGVTGWRATRGRLAEPPARSATADVPSPGWAPRLMWVLLPAVASVLLLAVTKFLTQDVAAVPFLWILPLAVYLLSFILCFDSPRFYWRPVFLSLLVPALGAMAYLDWPAGQWFKVPVTVTVSTLALFVFCMVCHGEMVRLKPHPRFLTGVLLDDVGGRRGGWGPGGHGGAEPVQRGLRVAGRPGDVRHSGAVGPGAGVPRPAAASGRTSGAGRESGPDSRPDSRRHADVRDKFGDERRTAIAHDESGDFTDEDLIGQANVLVSYSAGAYIKRMATDVFNSQKRGGAASRGWRPRTKMR